MQDRHPYAVYNVQPCGITPGGVFLEFVAFERYNLTLDEAKEFLAEIKWKKSHDRNHKTNVDNFQLFQLTPVTELAQTTA
jgi:hypothetical protein